MGLVHKLLATATSIVDYPLRSRSALGALIDFAVVQVAARLVDGDLCVPFPNDTRLLVPPRMKGAAHFISPGLCEFEQMSFVAHYLRPGDLFVDVGANLGAYSLLASAVAGADAICIEPCRSTFEYLQRTIRLNQLDTRTQALNLAAGNKPGTASMTSRLGTENYISSGSDNTNEDTEVTVLTLDHILADRSPTLVKIDVEGFESAVIQGAAATLRRDSLEGMIIERASNASRYGFDEERLHNEIRSMGYSPFTYSPSHRNLIPLPADASGNIIYLRRPEGAGQRLKTAPPFRFRGFTI